MRQATDYSEIHELKESDAIKQQCAINEAFWIIKHHFPCENDVFFLFEMEAVADGLFHFIYLHLAKYSVRIKENNNKISFKSNKLHLSREKSLQ